MKSLMSRIKALALLLAVAAYGGAWAAVPVPTVVWESDFSTTVSKTGRDGNDYKISALNGLSINGDGNLVVDTANAQGALIDLPDGEKTAATVLIKYSNLTAETTGNATLANFGVTSDGSSYYYIGSRSTSSGQLTLTPYWESSTYPINNATYGSGTVPSMQTGSGYLVFAYDSSSATHTYTGSSLSSLSGGYNSQLRWGSYKVGNIYIGGGQNKGKAYCWKGSGTVIEKVAIFLGSAYTASQLAEYRWPSEIKAVLPDRDMININISNEGGYAITGDGVETISTLAGEMLDNAWQNTKGGTKSHSGSGDRNAFITGVTAYDASTKSATELSDVGFAWAVEADDVGNYGYQEIENNPTFHKAWLARYNKGVETSSILVQSIPYRKYDIIVYCFGVDDSAFNPVFVNGVPYVGDTSLATDTKTRKATSSSETWGGRRAQPSFGQTAIMLKGLENPELSLTIRSGYTSICAVQILRDMSEDVWPTSKKVISLNLMSAYSSNGTTPSLYGLEPVPNEAWTKDGLSESSSFDKDVAVTIKEWNGSTTVDTSVTLHEKGGNGFAWSGYNYTPQSQFLTGYIDDTSQQQSVTVGDIPYACYDVIVYCATDNGDKQFGPVTVNGTSYRWDDDKQCAVIASSGSSTAETRWGATQSRLPAYGRNAIRIPDQTASTLTITGGDNANNARGGIAAIQIVEAYSGLKVYSNGSWSDGTEPTSGDAIIVVDGDTSLTIDGTASLGTVTITGNGTLTLLGSGQFTATTVDVESLATVNANPDRLGTTTYVGSGTVVYSGRAPEAGKGWSDSANWTGTLEIKDYTTSLGNFHLATYGNSESKVCLNNATGYLYSTANSGNHGIKELVIGAGGFTQNGSYSIANTFVVPCKVTGSGEYTFSATGSGQKTLFLSGDIAEFAGEIAIGGENNRVVIGSSTDRSFVDQSLIVCSGKSLTVRKQWGTDGFSGGIFVDANGLLEVASTGFLPASGGFTIDGVLKTAGLNYKSFGHIAKSATYTAADVLINDTGVLELTSSGDTKEANDAAYLADYSTVTGTGTLKFSSSSGWRTFPDAQARLPPTTLTVKIELAGGLIITMNDETAIGNLAGSKNIRSDWDAYHKTLTVTQSKDTTWEGKFTNNRIDTFKVTGSGGTLTLTGTHDISIAAQIESTGKVNLTGTWVGATTVAGTFGGTGTLQGSLTFSDGATFKAGASALTVTGTVTTPDSGSVTVDVSAISESITAIGVTLISGGVSEVGTFAVDSAYRLDADNGALKVYPAVTYVAEYGGVQYETFADAIAAAEDAGGTFADVTVLDASAELPAGYYIENNVIKQYQAAVLGGTGTVINYYATAQAAVAAVAADHSLVAQYDHFEVYNGTDVAITVPTSAVLDVLGVKIKCLNGASVVVSAPSADVNYSAGEPDENSIVTYTKIAVATTYVWTGATSAGADTSAKNWARPNNWKIGSASGAAASRAPSSIDTAVLESGAYANIPSAATVAAVRIDGAVTLTGVSMTLTATTGGIVLTDAVATLTVTGVTLSPMPTSGNANYVILSSAGEDVTTYYLGEKINDAGYMDGTTAVITDTSRTVTVPSTATAVKIAITGEDATLESSTLELTEDTVAVYATDVNGAMISPAVNITGAFKITRSGSTYKVELDDEVTDVKPAVTTEGGTTPMAVTDGAPTFTIKTIPGLWYVVYEGSTVGALAPVRTPSQAEDGTTSVGGTAPESGVKYYKIAVGASKAALTPAE